MVNFSNYALLTVRHMVAIIVETTSSIEAMDSRLRAYCLESLQSKYSSFCSVHFEDKCFDVDMYHQLIG